MSTNCSQEILLKNLKKNLVRLPFSKNLNQSNKKSKSDEESYIIVNDNNQRILFSNNQYKLDLLKFYYENDLKNVEGNIKTGKLIYDEIRTYSLINLESTSDFYFILNDCLNYYLSNTNKSNQKQVVNIINENKLKAKNILKEVSEL